MSTAAAPGSRRPLTIVHISDTHGLHRAIESGGFQLPAADLLVHTGDFTDTGADGEFAEFDAWCAEVEARYTHGVVVIAGNHEYKAPLQRIAEGRLPPADVCGAGFVQSRLRHARSLHHETLVVEGLRIYGSPWVPWSRASDPDAAGHGAGHGAARAAGCAAGAAAHRFGDVPPGTDVLLTHGPARGILDTLEGHVGSSWGSSTALLAAVYRAKPVAHLFGHLHEQRGQWLRPAATSAAPDAACTPGPRHVGGVEYQAAPGVPYATSGPPPADYPATLVSCAAMKNHPGVDGRLPCIAGPGRMIVATPPAFAGQ